MTIIDHGETFWEPVFEPIPEEKLATINDPEWFEAEKGDRAQILRDLAEAAHDFVHIGDSPEHDPLRENALRNISQGGVKSVRGLFNDLLHPDTPEVARIRVRQTLLNLATAGLILLDLRVAELNWDNIVAEEEAQKYTPEQEEAFAEATKLLAAIFAPEPVPEQVLAKLNVPEPAVIENETITGPLVIDVPTPVKYNHYEGPLYQTFPEPVKLSDGF